MIIHQVCKIGIISFLRAFDDLVELQLAFEASIANMRIFDNSV